MISYNQKETENQTQNRKEYKTMKNRYAKIRLAENETTFSFMKDFVDEYIKESAWSTEAKFRSCTATYGRTENYIYLRSYNTIVAIIDIDSREAFDILRTEYGYTATSAQHIAKFFHTYSGCFDRLYRTNYDQGMYYQRLA